MAALWRALCYVRANTPLQSLSIRDPYELKGSVFAARIVTRHLAVAKATSTKTKTKPEQKQPKAEATPSTPKIHSRDREAVMLSFYAMNPADLRKHASYYQIAVGKGPNWKYDAVEQLSNLLLQGKPTPDPTIKVPSPELHNLLAMEREELLRLARFSGLSVAAKATTIKLAVKIHQHTCQAQTTRSKEVKKTTAVKEPASSGPKEAAGTRSRRKIISKTALVKKVPLSDLRQIATTLGINSSGNKSELAERLANHLQDAKKSDRKAQKAMATLDKIMIERTKESIDDSKGSATSQKKSTLLKNDFNAAVLSSESSLIESGYRDLTELGCEDLQKKARAFGRSPMGTKNRLLEKLQTHLRMVAHTPTPRSIVAIDVGVSNLGFVHLRLPQESHMTSVHQEAHSSNKCAQRPVILDWGVFHLDVSYADLKLMATECKRILDERLYKLTAGVYLLERQSWRAIDDLLKIPPAVLASRTLEGMLLAMLLERRKEVPLIISPRRVSQHFGLTEQRRWKFSRAPAASVYTAKKSSANNLVKQLLSTGYVECPFELKCNYLETKKRDDMSDALLTALAWFEWWAAAKSEVALAESSRLAIEAGEEMSQPDALLTTTARGDDVQIIAREHVQAI